MKSSSKCVFAIELCYHSKPAASRVAAVGHSRQGLNPDTSHTSPPPETLLTPARYSRSALIALAEEDAVVGRRSYMSSTNHTLSELNALLDQKSPDEAKSVCAYGDYRLD